MMYQDFQYTSTHAQTVCTRPSFLGGLGIRLLMHVASTYKLNVHARIMYNETYYYYMVTYQDYQIHGH